jgi:hypothetical protein
VFIAQVFVCCNDSILQSDVLLAGVSAMLRLDVLDFLEGRLEELGDLEEDEEGDMDTDETA